jgi:hypothetical protein
MSKFQAFIGDVADVATLAAAKVVNGTKTVREELKEASLTAKDAARDRWIIEKTKREMR